MCLISSPDDGGVEDEEELDYEQAIKGFLLTRPAFACKEFRSRHLNRICANVNIWSGERLCWEIASYLADVFPAPQAGPAKAGRGGPQECRTKRLARRAEYAKSQKLWSKNRCIYIKSVLESEINVTPPSPQVIDPLWRAIMTRDIDCAPSNEPVGHEIQEIWAPIQLDEIRSVKFEGTTASGPDGLSVKQYKGIPNGILPRVLNILMLQANYCIIYTVEGISQDSCGAISKIHSSR